MTESRLCIDLLAFATAVQPTLRLEARMKTFLEAIASTESLDGVAFAQIIGSRTKADYLLGNRTLIAELKTINSDPRNRMERALEKRFTQADAPLVFGTLGMSKVVESLHDRDALNKMLIDVAGRRVRQHLQKANEQIGAIKERLGLPNTGGLVILMNDAEPMIDASATGYAIKSAFETAESGYPHITNVWASVECHKIQMSGGRIGFPQLHVFKSQERQAELNLMSLMLSSWGQANGSRLERLEHRGSWDAMRPIYDGPTPTLAPLK